MVRNRNISGKDSSWYILSSMIYYMILQKNDSKRVEEEYYKVLSLLQVNYPNNYVYTSFVFPKSIKDNRLRLAAQLENVEQSYRVAEKLGNEFGISVAWHWKGIIYAVKDDIFKDEERTKFFDYIITVIPIINSSNSKDKLKSALKAKGCSNDGISDEDLSEIAFLSSLAVSLKLFSSLVSIVTTLAPSISANGA